MGRRDRQDDDPQVRKPHHRACFTFQRQHAGGGPMIRSAAFAFFVLLLCSTTALANEVRGRVTDPQSKPVAGAKVLILQGTTIVATATTTTDGQFGPIDVQPAPAEYDVIVTAPGL